MCVAQTAKRRRRQIRKDKRYRIRVNQERQALLGKSKAKSGKTK